MRMLPLVGSRETVGSLAFISDVCVREKSGEEGPEQMEGHTASPGLNLMAVCNWIRCLSPRAQEQLLWKQELQKWPLASACSHEDFCRVLKSAYLRDRQAKGATAVSPWARYGSWALGRLLCGVSAWQTAGEHRRAGPYFKKSGYLKEESLQTGLRDPGEQGLL